MRASALISAAAAVSLLLTGCGSSAAEPAVSVLPSPTPMPPAPTPYAQSVSAYPDIRVYIDGLLCDRGIVCGERMLIPLDALSALCGVTLTADQNGSELRISGEGLEFYASENSLYVRCNERFYYSCGGYVMENGRVYLPPELAAWIFGVSVSVGDGRVDIDSSTLHLMEGWVGYYDDCYSYEDLYWLTHIIFAEAEDQPFEGKIAVGNVVINRLKSEFFPGNVLDVIYDTEHTVQFEPTSNGRITNDPDEDSFIAAYIALEGYSTVGDCMYFVNPEKAYDGWFREQKQYMTTIGKHDFYAERENP